MNKVRQSLEFGQSIWYDNIERGMLKAGKFEKMIAEDGLRGVTSNPTIFDKAISKSNDYDDAILRLIDKGLSAEEIYWELVIEDIQKAADIFLPVYEQTQGLDGFISIEVSPLLAHDAKGTVEQARSLFKRVARKNVMIKIPATKAGVTAIETVIADGINVNVTLIFSVARYREVMEAYLSGLEAIHWKHKRITGARSVASFFVSRVDSTIDKLLDDKIRTTPYEVEKQKLKMLKGKAGIANSKVAYKEFKKVFSSARYEALKIRGGSVQRPLWASTSTKNPEYSDVMYVEQLMGQDTVNTLPPATLDAFRDHGKGGNNIEENMAENEAVLRSLADHDIHLDKVTDELEEQGVESFSKSFNELLAHLNEKKEKLQKTS